MNSDASESAIADHEANWCATPQLWPLYFERPWRRAATILARRHSWPRLRESHARISCYRCTGLNAIVMRRNAPPTPPLRAKQCVIARMPWTIPGIMEHARNHTPRAQQASHRVSRHANLATGTRAVDSHTSAFEKTQFVDNPVLPIPGSGQTPLLSPLANRTPSASKRTSASLRLTACAFKFPSRHGPSPHPTAWQRNHTL